EPPRRRRGPPPGVAWGRAPFPRLTLGKSRRGLEPDMTLPANTRPLVTGTEVTKTYATRDGPVLALDHVSFDVPTGQFLSIVGPSGCGKSTLMLLVAGLLPASSGTITVDGVTVQRPYTNLGIVFQDAVLLDWRRVLDNLLLQI